LEQAQAVAPDMPNLKIAIAYFKYYTDGNWIEADRIFREILGEQGHSDLNASKWYGLILMSAGRNNDALPYLQHAKRLDPLDSDASLYLSIALINLKKKDQALMEVKRGQALQEYNSLFVYMELVIALENNNRTRAAAILDNNFKLDGDYPDATMLKLSELLLMEDTEAALSEMKALSNDPDIPPFGRMVLSHIASGLGDPELAFESFKKSGLKDIDLAVWHPIHKGVRQLPAFKTYVREKSLYDY
jgi:tetratricopeptide (TPR) repeat protein